MVNPNHYIDQFLGGDPLTAAKALDELVALGDAAEEAFFSRPIQFPKTVQVRRRWFRYLASRGMTVIGRLVERLQNQTRFNDAHTAAHLFAGIGQNREATDALYAQLEPGFKDGRLTSATFHDYGAVSNRFLALGYAGGDAHTLWRYVSGSPFSWEKLATFAFRGACAAFARMDIGAQWTIEQLITHEWCDFGLVSIGESPEARISNQAIQMGELWLQANDTFLVWGAARSPMRSCEVGVSTVTGACVISPRRSWRVSVFNGP